eukprot:15891960-Heterocapsa_arctica.AAC.1
MVLELRHCWVAGAQVPVWRVHQSLVPHEWVVRRPISRESVRGKWWCNLPYAAHGLVGVDVKSHQ